MARPGAREDKEEEEEDGEGGGGTVEETQGRAGFGRQGRAEAGKSTRHCLPLYTHVTLV